MNTCLQSDLFVRWVLTLSPAPVSLVHHVAGNEHLVGAGVRVTHGAGNPGAQTVARLRPSGGAGLKYTLMITVYINFLS